jgi:peptide/nickel transport system substrate-binding protein
MLTAFFFFYHRFFVLHSHSVPTRGGILTESTIGNIRNLNPFAPQQSLLDRDLSRLIFEGLLKYNPVSGQIEDGLAEFRISEDSKTYFLTLKQSAQFQDGSRVTVDDILFTFESVIQNPSFANTVLHNAFEYVLLNVVDKDTVAFILPEQNVFFLSLLTTPILPQKYFEGALIEEVTDPDFPFNKNPVGTGPYVLKNIVPNDDGSFRVFLMANEHYYKGRPYIDQVVFYVYPSFEHLNAIHEWTTLFSKIPYIRGESFEKKLIEAQLADTYQKREYLLPRFTALFYNLDKPLMEKPFLRDALNMSLDKNKILEKEKGWKKIDSFFFFEGVDSWHEIDIAQARRNMRDSGFRYDREREVRTLEGSNDPLTITMLTSTAPPVYSRFAQNIARIWEKELDIKVKLEILPNDEFQKALSERKYDVVLFGQNFSQNFDALSTWHSSQSGKFNLSNLTHDTVDFLIGEVRFSGAQSDLFALSDKLEDIAPAFMLATPQYNFWISERLQGFSEYFGKIRSHSERFSGIENWYFDQKLDWNLPDNTSRVWGFLKWLFGMETPSHEKP